MKFQCNTNDLQKSITIVEKAISSRSAMPILENLFLEIKDNMLKLRGNDLEIGIENTIPIESIQQEGTILVKAKTLSSIISKLETQTIQIDVNENRIFALRGTKVDLDIQCDNPTDYPKFPAIEEGTTFTISVEELKDMIKYTLFAVSHDETKQFLNGILVKNSQDKLIFVATDGFRLSKKQMTILPLEKEFSVIIPQKTISELYKIIQSEKNDNKITITISDNQVAFKLNNIVLISRVIMGQFPDYNQVIPQSTQNTYKILKKSLLHACDRAAVLAALSSNIVRFSFSETNVTILANSPGYGDFKEEVDLTSFSQVSPKKIAFNIRLMLDVIRNTESEHIIVSFNNELSPCKIIEEGNEEFIYIIMPIRTSDFQG